MADGEASANSVYAAELPVGNLTTNLSDNDMGSSNQSGYYFMEYDIGERARAFFSQPTTIVALILGFLAISLNVLAILAISKIRGSFSPHYRFIFSLAVSDILIGASVTMHIINKAVNPGYYPGIGPAEARLRSRCLYVVIKALNTTSLNITLLNLMGMAIDHFLAIVKPLHYPTLMNKHRASVIIATFWAIAILCGFSDFMSGYPKYPRNAHRFNYCEFIYITKYQEEYPTFTIALVCAVIMMVSYAMIVRAIRQRHRGMELLRPDNTVRNKKAVVTTLLILGTFFGCWLPMCMFQLALIIQVKVDPKPLEKLQYILLKADTYLYDLLMLNAILDPIIYAVRMREIQMGYRRLLAGCTRNKFNQCSTLGETVQTSLVLPEQDHRNNSNATCMKMAELHPNAKTQVTVNATPDMTDAKPTAI